MSAKQRILDSMTDEGLQSAVSPGDPANINKPQTAAGDVLAHRGLSAEELEVSDLPEPTGRRAGEPTPTESTKYLKYTGGSNDPEEDHRLRTVLDGTVEEVLEHLRANPDDRDVLLAIEGSDTGKQRTTILNHA